MPLIRKGPSAPAEPAPPNPAMLRNGTVEERWNAASAFEAVPGGAQILGQALGTEPDARVREAIFISLARMGSQESVAAVIPHLRSDDANFRTGALDTLRAMIQAVRPQLHALLSDPDPDIRILICDLVRELPAEEGIPLLCRVLDHDLEPNVCAAAVDVLAEIGDASAIPSLNGCAARFPDVAFLTFAVKITVGRLAAS